MRATEYILITNIIAITAIFLFACGDNAAAPNGNSCEASEDCESEFCAEAIGDLELPGGLCTNECDVELQEGCDVETEICLIHLKSDEQLCFELCDTDRDCREGWRCFALGFLGTGPSACIPEA